MRDEIDGRFWVENHDAFAHDVGAALASLRGWLGRRHGAGLAPQLLALAAAFAVTALTLNAAIVA